MRGAATRGGRGHRGRGCGRGIFMSANYKKTTGKQMEMKFYPHGTGKQQQTITYKTMKEHMIQQVQRMYRHGHDIAMSLRNLEKIDLVKEVPERKLTDKQPDKEGQTDQVGLDMVYQAEIKQFLARKETFNENMTKAYALIYSTYCNKTM